MNQSSEAEAGSVAVEDEEVTIVNESPSIVEGTWRRMFELDMREDAADFSSKILEEGEDHVS